MPNRNKSDEAHISIIDAVETLSSIVDINFERDVDIATGEEVEAQNQLVIARTLQWLENPDQTHTVKLITKTFHTVLDYLKNFYKHDYRQVNQPQVVEGVKTIMVLVGEAAKKLDRYTTLFQQTKARSVKNLKEYKQLQEFYLTRIARRIDESVLGKWILELTRGVLAKRAVEAPAEEKKPIHAKHVFIDMESVKKDTEYELFFLRKEDGSRFFNPRLIRNIKLVADFGESITEVKENDPFESLKLWQDQVIHTAAVNILQSQGGVLDRFFHEAKLSWKRELVGDIYKALIALLMCCNSKNLLEKMPQKSCTEYFADFLHFLRSALNTREYQRLLLYPPKKSSRLAHCLLDITHRLCRSLFTSIKGYQAVNDLFAKVIREAELAQSPEHEDAAKACQMLWSRLASDYAGIKKLIRLHPNGPLVKVLDIFQQGTYHIFDPIAQFNLPNQLYSLFMKENKISHLHLPSPTSQEFIHKAKVLEEFKTFIRAYSRGQFKRRFLLINLQDRTSWREHFRAVAVEEVAKQLANTKTLVVVTLPKDTEFYHQEYPYAQDNHAEVFLAHFKENLMDEGCGFYFPSKLKKVLMDQFVDGMFEVIHRVFFSNMNVLTVKNRLDFIEIFYLFLQLKILELTRSDSFSFTCKDGIDVGGCASMGLFSLLKIVNGEVMSENDFLQLNVLLYAPALLIRERTVLSEPFERMISALKRIEVVKQEMGRKAFEEMIKTEIRKFYSTSILNSLVAFPGN